MQTYPFISQDVENYIKERFGIKIGNNVYSKMMKANLQVSYKKENHVLVIFRRREWNYLNVDLQNIIPHLSELDMVISIDYSSFSRATKLTHSWLTKGKHAN